MSEVTAKDLRDEIMRATSYRMDSNCFEEDSDIEARGEKYLAAFDAMAEKAEAYEKLQSLDKSLSLEVALRMVRGE